MTALSTKVDRQPAKTGARPLRNACATESIKPLRLLEGRRLDSRPYPRKFADKNVEHRREKDAEKCHSQHTREDGCPERLTHLGASSTAQHQWCHTRDECERGHQDRAQT